ncbi:Hypothetical predicted protein [Cloeon dipterum]|nr:Hypothetical predicted protein [Cloeon dipterum]
MIFGLSLAAVDVDDEEPIHYTIRMGHYDLAKMLLEMRHPGTGFNLLHYFVMKNNHQVNGVFAKAVHSHDNNLAIEFDAEGRTVLHLAAEFTDLRMIDWVMKELGLRPNEPQTMSAKNASVLHHAVLNQRHAAQIIRYFASRNLFPVTYEYGKVDLNARNDSGETPLQLALVLGKIDAAKDLVKFGADVDLKMKGKNLLHLCVEKNMLSNAQLVHKWDYEEILKRDSTGRKVIHVAAENADRYTCEWLVQVQKDDDVMALCYEKGSSAIHRVGLNVKYGNKDLIYFFKSLGFSLEQRDKEGLTPLHYALRAGNLKVASDMIKVGADLRLESNSLNLIQYCVRHDCLESAKFIHEKDRKLITKVCESGGRTVLHIAAEFADEEMCRWLVSQGASVPTLSEDAENNVLHFATMNFTHGVALIKYFHTFGIALNARNKFYCSPLHVALERENLKVADCLLNLGANINMYIDHSNLIHFCAKRNKLDAAKFLHERNQELTKEPCFGGRTTLHTAAQFSTVEFCQWLVENGVNTQVRDNLGRLAWQYVPHGKNELKTYFQQFYTYMD